MSNKIVVQANLKISFPPNTTSLLNFDWTPRTAHCGRAGWTCAPDAVERQLYPLGLSVERAQTKATRSCVALTARTPTNKARGPRSLDSLGGAVDGEFLLGVEADE